MAPDLSPALSRTVSDRDRWQDLPDRIDPEAWIETVETEAPADYSVVLGDGFAFRGGTTLAD